MKKFLLIATMILCAFFVWAYASYDSCNEYKRLLNCPLVTWKGIRIEIPKGFSYTLDEERMMIVKSNDAQGAYLALHKAASEHIENVAEKFKANNREIISSATRSVEINARRATEVTLAFAQGISTTYVAIPEIMFLATYSGPSDQYHPFLEILKNISFTKDYATTER